MLTSAYFTIHPSKNPPQNGCTLKSVFLNHRFHILHFPNSTGLFTKPTGRHYTKYRFSSDIAWACLEDATMASATVTALLTRAILDGSGRYSQIHNLSSKSNKTQAWSHVKGGWANCWRGRFRSRTARLVRRSVDGAQFTSAVPLLLLLLSVPRTNVCGRTEVNAGDLVDGRCSRRPCKPLSVGSWPQVVSRVPGGRLGPTILYLYICVVGTGQNRVLSFSVHLTF